MKKKFFSNNCLIPVMAAVLILSLAAGAHAGHTGIDGITGQTTFEFTAGPDYITTADGGNYLIWGYAAAGHNNGRTQYPGPTLIVNQGETITVNLTNQLGEPVSIIFPGQGAVAATGGSPGLLTSEAPASYTQSTVPDPAPP